MFHRAIFLQSFNQMFETFLIKKVMFEIQIFNTHATGQTEAYLLDSITV